jgi:hypothetical protein
VRIFFQLRVFTCSHLRAAFQVQPRYFAQRVLEATARRDVSWTRLIGNCARDTCRSTLPMKQCHAFKKDQPKDGNTTHCQNIHRINRFPLYCPDSSLATRHHHRREIQTNRMADMRKVGCILGKKSPRRKNSFDPFVGLAPKTEAAN